MIQPSPKQAAERELVVVPVTGPEWVRCEAELAGPTDTRSLPQRFAWADAFEGRESFFLAARDGAGVCRGGVAVAVSRSRALPGHRLFRVPRCVPAGECGVLEPVFAALAALAGLARQNPRVLRANVELFSPDAARRADAGRRLAALGFRPAREQRNYRHTLSVDLRPPEDAIFAGLHRRARRAVRAVEKKELELRPVTDPALSGRMEEIRRATYDRLGGRFVPRDWGAVMTFSRRHPEWSRLVGLFAAGSSAPGALLAYTWGLHHTDHAEYFIGAAARDAEVKCPLMYGLMWDLIRWAKRHGATWFDLGGITAGTFGDPDDVLGGVSDFKRTFSTTQVHVCDEWEYEPHPWRAALAHAIGRVARRFARH
jgi:hypothetical protein